MSLWYFQSQLYEFENPNLLFKVRIFCPIAWRMFWNLNYFLAHITADNLLRILSPCHLQPSNLNNLRDCKPTTWYWTDLWLYKNKRKQFYCQGEQSIIYYHQFNFISSLFYISCFIFFISYFLVWSPATRKMVGDKVCFVYRLSPRWLAVLNGVPKKNV